MAILRQRGAPNWELDPDAQRGLKDTVRNGQPRLAIEYVQVILEAQANEIAALKAEIESMQATMKDLVRMSTTEKPVRARTEKPAEQPDSAGAS